MSETSDQHSMHAAVDSMVTLARAGFPQEAANYVIAHLLHRVRRGVEDAKTKGASDTQVAYLNDLCTVMAERINHLAEAVVADPSHDVVSSRPPAADDSNGHDDAADSEDSKTTKRKR